MEWERDSASDGAAKGGFAPQGDSLRYLFIDFNAYFASVEQHDDPSIRGRPVIVTPLASEHSGAIAASYEAKEFGIKRGTSVIEARALCPDIIIRPARHDRYVRVHHDLLQVVGKYLPVLRVCSIDEWVCRLSREEWGAAAAMAKAREVKRGLLEFSSALRASIGLAPSVMLAKLATDLQKPDGLVALPSSCLPDALEDLPLRAIAGIGAGVEARLERAGVRCFRDLWNLEPRHARAIWNSVEGERFVYGLHGYDVHRPEPAEKRMIGHSRVLSGADRQPDGARIVLRALLLKAASRLRHYGLHAGSMHVSARLYPEGAVGHDLVFRPTQNSWRLLHQIDEFWPAMMAAAQHRFRSRSIKLVTVYLASLQAGPPERDLFIAASRDADDGREAALWGKIDELNQRYGMTKVTLASQTKLDLNYLGVKIAFSRVPELAEFAATDSFDAMSQAASASANAG